MSDAVPAQGMPSKEWWNANRWLLYRSAIYLRGHGLSYNVNFPFYHKAAKTPACSHVAVGPGGGYPFDVIGGPEALDKFVPGGFQHVVVRNPDQDLWVRAISKLGVEDHERACNAIKGATGKRLMYRQPDPSVRD